MSIEAINKFYGQALSVNTETNPGEVLTPILADGYESTGSVESKNAEQLIGQLGFFWKVVPDLKWEIQETIMEGDRVFVRSIASGTPNGDFMGMPTDGSKSFKIMTMDIHTFKDGKILSTHHVEDWATAMKQLKS